MNHSAAAQLTGGQGASTASYFQGRTVRVFGAAQRVRIDFLDPRGRPTGKYYYQTHVRVNDPRQLQLVD
jgi:hypothetical protein